MANSVRYVITVDREAGSVLKVEQLDASGRPLEVKVAGTQDLLEQVVRVWLKQAGQQRPPASQKPPQAPAPPTGTYMPQRPKEPAGAPQPPQGPPEKVKPPKPPIAPKPPTGKAAPPHRGKARLPKRRG